MDDPGGGGPSWSFGSRFELLPEIISRPTADNKPSRNKQNKRTATKNTNCDTDYRKLQRIDPSSNGGRYLILTRTDNNQTMNNVSPFFIKKAIDNITPNIKISRIRDGSLLLKSTDYNQAVKLMKQTILGGEIGIKIVEHPTLNQSRGTIYCPDLIWLNDEDILEGLKESRVVAIRRITRKTREGKPEDTGTFILTFNLPQIPTTIDVGFYNCRVRQYIPSPLRCTNCLKFGHKADQS